MPIEREAPLQSKQQVCDIISLRERREEEPKVGFVAAKRVRMDAQASEADHLKERKGLYSRLEICAIVNSNHSQCPSSSCTMYKLINSTRDRQVANRQCWPTRQTQTATRTHLSSSSSTTRSPAPAPAPTSITDAKTTGLRLRRTGGRAHIANNKILFAAFTLFSCILLCQAVVGGDSPLESTASLGPSSPVQDSKAAKPNERSDGSPVSGKSSSPSSIGSQSPSASSSSTSSQTSIAASLSSAVATAAAAVAVAAAQSGLSGGDARSGGGHSSTVHSSHAQRSPSSPSGIHLAFKLADAIPEVPYNILHNMKKLDHAAPFYNVNPNKMSGSSKESGAASFIGSALSSPAAASFGADQLANLFRSPLWKRLADGYGEFTSEFRSLFRAPAPAHPMKGSTGGASKLLRDISVPALLVLLASAIPADWRPVRTRRKALSLVPPPLPAAAGHLWPSASTSASLADQHPFKQSSESSLMNLLNYGEHRAESGLQTSPNQQLHMEESSQRANWLPSPAGQPQLQQQPQQQPQQLAPTINGNHPHLDALNSYQQQPQHQAVVRRSGELAQAYQQQEEYLRRREDPVRLQQEIDQPLVARQAATGGGGGGLLGGGGSLAGTSNRIMNRIFDANFNNFASAFPILYKSSPLLATTSAIKRDQLSDKQRYTLIGPTDSNDSNYHGEQSRPKATFLLSAMSQAITSMLNHPAQPESGSAAAAVAAAPAQNSFLKRQQAAGQMEQRDLTKLLPESWREVVKRTMTTVQQQANSQWKSIEGQVANWLQDKLKSAAASVGAAATAASSSSTSTSSSSSSTPTTGSQSSAGGGPAANILASVGSTAMNILGLGNKSNSSSASTPTGASSTASVLVSSPPSSSSSSSKPKTSSSSSSSSSSNNKGPLAGVAGLIMNTLTNRSSATPSSPGQIIESNDEITQKSSAVVSQYPTLSGAQPADESAPTAGSLPALSLAGPSTSSLATSTTPGASQSSS